MDKKPFLSIAVSTKVARLNKHIIQELKNASYEIILMRDKKNSSVVKMANQAALKAHGEYIFFSNHGVPIKSYHLKNTIEHAEKPGVGAVTCGKKGDKFIVISRTAMSKTGLFNEKYSSFSLACQDYGSRLKKKGYKYLYLNRPLDKLKPALNKNASFSRAVSPFKNSHFLRSGMIIASERSNKQIRALVRLSDFEMFSVDRIGKKIWKSLGERKNTLRLSRNRVEQYINEFVEQKLIIHTPPIKTADPIVSVMMAAYNSECWIGEAIESVLAQTFRRFELIVIDDGSTDKTAQVVQEYASHPQIRFFRNPKQLGIAATRNRILSLSHGKYIAICDSDDVLRSTLLERFVEILESRPKIGWVYADFLTINELGQRLNIIPALPMDGYREFQRNVVCHGGSLIRRQLMLDVGGYNETLMTSEDYDLAMKISERAEMHALTGEIYYLWRHHPESISQNSSVNPWLKKDIRRVISSAIRRRQKLPKDT